MNYLERELLKSENGCEELESVEIKTKWTKDICQDQTSQEVQILVDILQRFNIEDVPNLKINCEGIPKITNKVALSKTAADQTKIEKMGGSQR